MTLSVQGFLANLSAWLEKGLDSKIQEALYSLKLPELLQINGLHFFSWKMSQDCYRTTKARRMKPSSPRLLKWGIISNGVIHNGTIRRLMPIECWRLQGFTDEQFNKAEATGLKDGRLYKMAGNSVTVPVISAIGRKIKELNERFEIVKE